MNHSLSRASIKRVRILLADDHTLFCCLLRELLEPLYDVVGTVSDGHALLQAAASLHPDVVLADISMPRLNGLDAGRRLMRSFPKVKLIYLTMNNALEYALQAIHAGASGFVLKNSDSSEVLHAIREALRGSTYIAPEIRKSMSEAFIRDPKALHRPQRLTDRQREVLQMIAEGKPLAEIALALKISYRTVRFHKDRIKDELGIRGDAELVKYAIKQGLVSTG